ncbi:MAG TPA: PHP domain-containing protein [Chloroflexota bacterium]|nr:PHP domain-containing protein [Chloroflexota bacterium]
MSDEWERDSVLSPQPSALADLHLHTTHSDGRLAPAAVVEAAAARGLTTIAVTDHDVVSGLDEARAAGWRLGVEVIPGVELTARWRGRTCHLLGYGVAATAPRLVAALAAARAAAQDAVAAALDVLRTRGHELTPADLARFRARYPTPTTLLLALVQRRLLRSRADLLAILPCLRAAAPGLPAADTIALVHAAGGAAVLAHPGRRARGRPIDRADLAALAADDLDGVEVDHPAHDAAQRAAYAAMAGTLGLVATGGSDWHGRPRDPRPGSLGSDAASLDGLRGRMAARRAALVGR